MSGWISTVISLCIVSGIPTERKKVDLAVINPNQFKAISLSVKKTDKNDAKVLAEFLEKDLLPEERMKNELQARVASLTQTREKLVQLRTVLKNKINEDFTTFKLKTT